MNAEVRPGYKLTEAGVIPEEWNSSSILTHLKEPIRNGYSPRCPETPTGTWVLSLSAVGFDGFNPNGIKPAPKNDPKIEQNLLRPQDIVISRSNTRDRVGLAGIYQGDPAPCAYPDLLMRIRVSGSLEPNFLLKQILSDRGRQYFSESARGSSGSMVKIDRGILESFPISVPSISEQHAITLTLSDMDALLNNIDQLIAKKRYIQQAAMQQLLTGQRRLPGFSGKWRSTTFSDLVRHHSGNSSLIKGKLSSEGNSGLYPAFSASGQDVWHTSFEHEGNAVIISAVGSRCGKAFMAQGKWSAIANTHVVWPIESRVDLRFLNLFINDESFWLKSGSGQPFVLFKQSFARHLLLPPSEEQEAIASTLADMAKELVTLEARRDKARQVKQGMMQELLTGRIRLV